MPDPRPFDLKRAAFWLVAIYVLAHIAIVFVGVGFCLYHGEDIVTGKFVCDSRGRLVDILDRPFGLFDVIRGVK